MCCVRLFCLCDWDVAVHVCDVEGSKGGGGGYADLLWSVD